MAFGGENVDQLISNCKDLVKSRKNEMMLTLPASARPPRRCLKTIKIDKTDCEEHDLLDEDEYEDQISKQDHDIDSFKTKLSETEHLIKMKADVTRQLAKMPEIEENIDDLEDELQRISTHRQGWERYQLEEKARLKKLNQTERHVQRRDEGYDPGHEDYDRPGNGGEWAQEL